MSPLQRVSLAMLAMATAFVAFSDPRASTLLDGSSSTGAMRVATATAPTQRPDADATLERRREALREARERLMRERSLEEKLALPLFVAKGRQRVAAMLALAREYPDLPSQSRELLAAAVMESAALAQTSRFSLGDTTAAATLYEQALSIELPAGALRLLKTIPWIGYADLARFDLRDPALATRLLRDAREMLRSVPDLNDPMSLLAHPIRRWVEAEIAFLQSRRRAAVPSATDCAPLELGHQFGRELLFAGNEPLNRVMLNGKGLYPEFSRKEVASALASLSPSAFNLLGASDSIATLGSADRMLAFARKHDPAGFLTACILRRLRDIALIPDKARREAAFGHYRWTAEDGRLLVSTANRVLGPK